MAAAPASCNDHGVGERTTSTRSLVAVAAALAACALAPAPALAADATVEGEALTLALGGDGAVELDGDASGGRALRISSGAAEGEIAVPQSTTHLFVRLRGEDCFGPPQVSVSVDGVERLVADVSTGGYGEPGARMSIPAGRHRVAVAVNTAGGAFCARSVWVDTVTAVGQPFSPAGWRNARLSKRAPIARDSPALVAELRAQIRSERRGAGVGTASYSSPVYTVPRDQPTVRVAAPGTRPDLQAQWDEVPLPPDARPAAGTDQNLVVWQPSTDTLWEFWGLVRDPLLGAWRARYGGRMPHVSRSEGHFTDPPGPQFGASATSIGLLAGMQRIEELRRGSIEHAVDFAVLAGRGRDGWCWPAQRTDPEHSSRSRSSIPAGLRLRLPPRLDLRAYARDPRHPLSRYALTVATAVQRYGMVVRESSSDVGFYAEDPTPLGWNPYDEIFEGRSPDGVGALRNFPWRRLQVLAQPRGRGCEYDPDRD